MPSDKLFYLLNNLNTGVDHFDSDAVIQEVRQNPKSAAAIYRIDPPTEWGDIYTCQPLHHAIRLGASIDVVKAIYNSYPPAIERKCNAGLSDEITALHIAILYNAPPEVTLFVLNAYPDAAQEMDYCGAVPLHLACMKDAPLNVVSMLVGFCPDAVWKKDYKGSTPLHWACRSASKESMTFLLENFPRAAREKDNVRNTPLHWALMKCQQHVSFEALQQYVSFEALQETMILLLEKWPEAVRESNLSKKTPLDAFEEMVKYRRISEANEQTIAMTIKILSYVDELCEGSIDKGLSEEMVNFFIDIEWWNGVLLVLDRYPLVKKQMGIEIKVFPNFLSLIGQRCKMKIIWQVIRNELDIMEGI